MLPPLLHEHVDRMKVFFNQSPTTLTLAAGSYRRHLAHYYRLLIPPGASVLEVGCSAGHLLRLLPNRDVTGIDVSEAQLARARETVPHGTFHLQAGEEIELHRTFDCIIVSDTLNLAADVQLMLERLHDVSTPRTRLVVNYFNSLWRPALSLATFLGLRARSPQLNWLATSDIRNLCALSGWEIVKLQHRLLLPVALLGLDRLVNRWLAPFAPWFCLTVFAVARPRRPVEPESGRGSQLSVSVVVPACNEAGNIAAAAQRVPKMGSFTEIIFVEGHSTDSTWEEIGRVIRERSARQIVAIRQPGKGKGDAVRAGFAQARGDLLMILDADLTVPPEELPKFYAAIASGRAEFANGVRLVYPLRDQAMRFLNLCANKFFSLTFSWLLDQPVKDTLCGTKVLRREDYDEIVASRAYFGEFDPFGDFDLLFGADRLNLKIADIPIRYQERVYGTTSIHRWRHGLLLLRMTLFAARKLKFV